MKKNQQPTGNVGRDAIPQAPTNDAREPAKTRQREIDGSPPEDTIEPDQIERRAAEFGVSPEELRVAIQRAGPSAKDVRAYLAR
jgi:hypothetical protein